MNKKQLQEELLILKTENNKLKRNNRELSLDRNFYKGKYEAILELTTSIYSGSLKIINTNN